MEDGDDLIGDTRNFVTRDEGLECQFVAEQPPNGDLRCIGSPVAACSIPGENTTQRPLVVTESSAGSSFSSRMTILAISLLLLCL